MKNSFLIKPKIIKIKYLFFNIEIEMVKVILSQYNTISSGQVIVTARSKDIYQ